MKIAGATSRMDDGSGVHRPAECGSVWRPATLMRTLLSYARLVDPALVAVFSTPDRDVTTVTGIEKAVDAGASVRKMENSRVGSWFATHSDGYVSKERHTMIATICDCSTCTAGSIVAFESDFACKVSRGS